MGDGTIAVFGLVAAAAVIAAAALADAYTCSSKADKMGLESSWGPIQGCMVKTKKRWLPMDSLREVDP